MARWKLTEPHYLNVPGTKWELTINDRVTGRPKRTAYPVPLFLHPESPTDWNYQPNKNDDGEIHVCYEGTGLPHDIIFVGDPTPGMLPLDEEAAAISAKFNWTPTAGTDAISQQESFQQKLLLGLMDQMSSAQAQAQQAPVAPGFEKFMEAMMAMMAQQTQILATMAGKLADVEFAKAGAALGEKPIIDEEPELEPVEPTEEEIAAAAQKAVEAEAASQARAEEFAQSRSGRRL